MTSDEVLAYLGGVIDGDGYLKIIRDASGLRARNPYYSIMIGLQQLWPSEAVALFAKTFEGNLRSYPTTKGTQMARCELRSAVAETATRRLLPFLLVKRRQALLVLDFVGVRPGWHSIPRDSAAVSRAETLRQDLLALHTGSLNSMGKPVSTPVWAEGLDRLGPDEWAWTRRQLFAYLAGIIDSDGNLRVEKKRVRGMIGPHYRINIRCAQVMPSPAVELLAKNFGGKLSLRKSGSPNHRDLVAWSLHDLSAVPALKALLPYLRVKKDQAHLLLELRRLKAAGKEGLTEWVHKTRWQRPIRMRKRCYTSGQVAEFERIRVAVQALHSVGRRAESGEFEIEQAGPIRTGRVSQE